MANLTGPTNVDAQPQTMPSPLPRQAIFVPLVTPLHEDRTADTDSLAQLIDFVLSAGVDGVLVLGSSGEAAALDAKERVRVASAAVAHVSGRCHVMVGVLPTGTQDAMTAARELGAVGADSLLAAAPAGFALSQVELGEHFSAIRAATSAPLVAYEVPGRVGVSLSPELLRRLGDDGVIAGVKDSSGNLAKARTIIAATRDVPGFVRYTGTEHCHDGEMLAGYDGAIPGIANVFPEFPVELMRRVKADDWRGAAEVQSAIVELLDLYSSPLADASFGAVFFASVKEALVQRGVIASAATSAPLIQGDEPLREHVRTVLETASRLRTELRMGTLNLEARTP